MNDLDVFNVVRDHIADGKRQHPEIKPLDNYPVLIREWGAKLEKALQDESTDKRHQYAGKLLLQTAGICIRGIEELNLPLAVPTPTS